VRRPASAQLPPEVSLEATIPRPLVTIPRRVPRARDPGGRVGTVRHCPAARGLPRPAARSAGGYPGRRQVAGIDININLYSPVFLQLGGLRSSGAWSASAGAFMKTSATYAVGFYDDECRMPGCAEFKDHDACWENTW
jgi:hypothetical protein